MTYLSEDETHPARPTSAARQMLERGGGPAPPGTGPFRRLARRALLRLLRPSSTHQRAIDARLLDAVDALERRLDDPERVQVELLAEDLVAALESLRSRVAEGEELIAGSRAVPYAASSVLEQFRDPFAGIVLGYRHGDGEKATYRGFEEVFRGPEERVRQRQAVFLELLQGHEPVLDAGCGRGELLDLMRDRGIAYMGVDVDAGMVARCREKGHESVELGTANEYLERLPEGSLGAIFSAQVVEHIPYPDLTRFIELSLARLQSGGMFVAETVNPHAPHALKTFWVDPTHQHPLFPEVALVLCRLAGFQSAYVFHPLGTGHVDDDRYRESEYAIVARKA